ncbi:MAG: hypothetical protein NC299_17830 [Lachnospiraceae bacterium]|nr:hypothetical protein [Lachnospiraceae bacterium]
MALTLQEKVVKFLDVTSMPKSTFCKRIDLSTQSLNAWLRGELNLSKDTLGRIENYLRKFDSILEND